MGKGSNGNGLRWLPATRRLRCHSAWPSEPDAFEDQPVTILSGRPSVVHQDVGWLDDVPLRANERTYLEVSCRLLVATTDSARMNEKRANAATANSGSRRRCR